MGLTILNSVEAAQAFGENWAGDLKPGEIFALTWGDMTKTSADISQRVYKGVIDSPKTHHSIRRAALPEQLLFLLAWLLRHSDLHLCH